MKFFLHMCSNKVTSVHVTHLGNVDFPRRRHLFTYWKQIRPCLYGAYDGSHVGGNIRRQSQSRVPTPSLRPPSFHKVYETLSVQLSVWNFLFNYQQRWLCFGSMNSFSKWTTFYQNTRVDTYFRLQFKIVPSLEIMKNGNHNPATPAGAVSLNSLFIKFQDQILRLSRPA